MGSYNLFAYCSNNPVCREDPNGHWTISVSLGVNVTLIFGAAISIGFAVDDNGNFDWQWSYSWPFDMETISYGLFDVGVGPAVQYTNADTVYDLYGASTYIGASGGPFWYVGGDVISFSKPSDSEAEIDGFQAFVGLGLGVDCHVNRSKTLPLIKKHPNKEDERLIAHSGVDIYNNMRFYIFNHG